MARLSNVIRIFTLVILFLTPVSAFADSEILLVPKERWDSLKEWQPDLQRAWEKPWVDFRPFLPKVGNQGRQFSCVGWAIGYANKTYLEVRDQGWKPDSSKRIFSPSYIYNQINNGKDRGSNVERALQLMVNEGCATLSVMPYVESDYLSSPSYTARNEAKKFRCSQYYPIKSGPYIRKALQQGHVVIISVRTDPVFSSGLFQVYTKREKQKGEAEVNLNPSITYGYHAMVVVGYDDMRKAFLLMNSWSERWGQSGYCWVAYDVMERVYPHTSNFAQNAWVLLDVREKIEPPVQPHVQVDKQFNVNGQHWYNGFKNNSHAWGWQASISASASALNNIKKVIWEVPKWGGGITTYVSTDAHNGFQVVSTALGLGGFNVKANVYFTDNTRKTEEYRFNFVAPKRRNFELVQTDQYWGRMGTQPYWEWTLKMEGSLVDLYDVKHVTYHLHPTFQNPNRVVYGNAQNGFAFLTRGWGTFEVKATVLFKDGSTLLLSKMLSFKSPVIDTLQLTNTAHPTTWSKTNKQYYNWTAYLEGPLKLLRNIKYVRYILHPTFTPNIREVHVGESYGFPLSTSGWGPFLLKADVHFKDNTVQHVSHMLKF